MEYDEHTLLEQVFTTTAFVTVASQKCFMENVTKTYPLEIIYRLAVTLIETRVQEIRNCYTIIDV